MRLEFEDPGEMAPKESPSNNKCVAGPTASRSLCPFFFLSSEYVPAIRPDFHQVGIRLIFGEIHPPNLCLPLSEGRLNDWGRPNHFHAILYALAQRRGCRL